jgi:uncharacterized protein involved in exopolysaccharide biosynthesis
MAGSQLNLEIDFFSLFSLVWKKWKIILASAILFAVLGGVYAVLAPSVYGASAMIAPRDNQAAAGGAASFFSQMGGNVGSFISTQLSAQNSNLDRMEILVQSPEIARKVIEDHNLLPRLYPQNWDAENRKWKKKAPNMRLEIEGLRTGNLSIVTDARKKTLTLNILASDSILATDIAGYYLSALNSKIQEDTRSDADGNRAYLETQLDLTQDPALRQQIQNMIATEIGKSMLVSTKTFDILEYPEVPLMRLAPKRKQIVLGAFAFGAILAAMSLVILQIIRDRKKKS